MNTMTWIVPLSYFIETPAKAVELLQESDKDGEKCGLPTWLYHLGGQYAENFIMNTEESVGSQIRTAGVVLMICTMEFLKKLADMFPATSGGWSPNHFTYGQDVAAGVDFVTTHWGKKTYETLLLVKQKYDPDYLFDCAYCVGWGPISQDYSSIMSSNPFYQE